MILRGCFQDSGDYLYIILLKSIIDKTIVEEEVSKIAHISLCPCLLPLFLFVSHLVFHL